MNDTPREVSNALARIAAAISFGADACTLRTVTAAALSIGATEQQVVGTLFAAGPGAGSARLVRAAPEIARAVGYDIDRALEGLDE